MDAHPFVNGNGRIARLLANYIAMRYGLFALVMLHPHPSADAYAEAGTVTMRDGDGSRADHTATV